MYYWLGFILDRMQGCPILISVSRFSEDNLYIIPELLKQNSSYNTSEERLFKKSIIMEGRNERAYDQIY